MICECKYNPTVDVCPVEQFGYVDLVECLSKGEIPSTISDTEMTYNDIDDPSTIMTKPRDNFEAIRLMDHIKSSGKITTPTSDNNNNE